MGSMKIKVNSIEIKELFQLICLDTTLKDL